MPHEMNKRVMNKKTWILFTGSLHFHKRDKIKHP